MAFIWAVKKQAEAHDNFRLAQAEAILQWIKKDKHQLLIPTIVLAESLIREPLENHALIMAEAYKHAQIVDFDSRAALQYGELLRLDNFQKAIENGQAVGTIRQKMKIDHIIIACALVHGADLLFSDDSGVKTFAEGRIKVQSIGAIPVQGNLELPNK
jgi:predicted nucleic acid-binding protein